MLYRNNYDRAASDKPSAAAAAADEEAPQKEEAEHGDVGARFVESVRLACSAAAVRPGSRGLSAFVIESGMSVGGVVLPPDGCLEAAFDLVRAAGGVSIADEVQVRGGVEDLGACVNV